MMLCIFFIPNYVCAEQGEVTGSIVNVRGGPGTFHDKVDKVSQGEKVLILDKQDGWYKVKLNNNRVGWILGELLNVSSSGVKEGTINGNVVNVRKGADTSYPIVFKVNQGENVKITKEQNGWYLIETNKGSGWVAGWLLDVKGSTNTTSSRTAMITGNVTNIRENAGTEYDKVGQVLEGDRVKIIGEEGDWYKIRTGSGIEGYVAGWLLSLEDGSLPIEKPKEDVEVSKPVIPTPTPVPTPIPKPKPTVPETNNPTKVLQTVIVTGQVVNIRQNPDIASPRVAQVNAGTELEIIAQQGDWLKAKLVDGRQGWIAGWLTEEKSSQSNLNPTSNKIKMPVGSGNTLTLNNLGNQVKINLSGIKKSDYQVNKAKNSNDLVIQVQNNQLNALNQKFNNWGIKDIVVEGKVILIKFSNEFSFKDTHSGNDLEVTITYPNDGLVPVKNIRLNPQETKSVLQIATNGNVSYKTQKLGPNKIAIDLPRTSLELASRDESEQEVGFGPVRKVTSRQLSPDTVRVETELAAGADYKVTQHDGYIILGATMSLGNMGNGTLRGKTIVIDPGHGVVRPGGWTDPGAIGRDLKLKERDVVLDVALKVREMLTREGANVVMTHTNARTYLSLKGRADVANNINADAFVSIHANASENRAQNGSATYYYATANRGTYTGYTYLPPQRAIRMELARCIQKELAKEGGRRNIGIIEQNIAVLRENRVPCALVETAFISNPTEERLLNTDSFRSKMAIGISNGIKEFFKNH